MSLISTNESERGENLVIMDFLKRITFLHTWLFVADNKLQHRPAGLEEAAQVLLKIKLRRMACINEFYKLKVKVPGMVMKSPYSYDKDL